MGRDRLGVPRDPAAFRDRLDDARNVRQVGDEIPVAKFVLKEVILPAGANKAVFLLAPLVAFTLALASWAVVPVAPGWLGGLVGGYFMAKFLDPLQPERGDHLLIAVVCIALTGIAVIV